MASAQKLLSSQLQELMKPVAKTLTDIRQSKLAEFRTQLYDKFDVARVIYEEAELRAFSDQLIAQTVTEFQVEIANPLLNVDGLMSALKTQLTKVKEDLLLTNRDYRAAISSRFNSLPFMEFRHRRMVQLFEGNLPSPDEEELALEVFTNASEDEFDSEDFVRQMMHGYTMMEQAKKDNAKDLHPPPHQMGSTPGLPSEPQEEIAGSSSSSSVDKTLVDSGLGQSAEEMDTLGLSKSDGAIVSSHEAASEMETEVEEDEDEMLHEDGTSGATRTTLKRKRPLSDGTKQPRMDYKFKSPSSPKWEDDCQ